VRVFPVSAGPDIHPHLTSPIEGETFPFHVPLEWDGKLPPAMYSNAPLPFFNLGTGGATAKQ